MRKSRNHERPQGSWRQGDAERRGETEAQTVTERGRQRSSPSCRLEAFSSSVLTMSPRALEDTPLHLR